MARAIDAGAVKRRAWDIAAVSYTHLDVYKRQAHEIGCGDGSIAKLLDEQEVRLTQEQWFYLMTLGGKQLA